MYQKRNKELAILILYLGDYTKQFYLREISKLSKIPLKTTQNLISNLENNKILRSITRGKNKYFKLNLDNIYTKLYLLQAEIYKTKLFLDKYPLFKTFLKEVRTNISLIVFGSFAKLKADRDSDLDVLIIPKEKLPFYLLPYKTHIIELTEDSFIKSLEKQETLIKEIKENHIILNNHSFYVNTLWNYHGK
jgi:predicted nucleotidyltransferase